MPQSTVTWAPALTTQAGDLLPLPEGMAPTLRVAQSTPFVASRDKWCFFHIGTKEKPVNRNKHGGKAQ